MKRWQSAILLVLLLCLIPFVIAMADTGTVIASSLNMRKAATTDSDVIKVLKEGTKVTITGSSGSWYKVTVDGKTGYVGKKYISVGKSSSSSSKKSNNNSSGGTCKPGDTGESVKKVQKRLKALGYYDKSIDGDYGNGTKSAVKEFQKKNNLKVTGEVNASTLKKLNSSDAKKASSSGGKTERLDWFGGGKNTIPKGATFQVKDCRTGKVFTVRRWSGYNHIDAEPLTASDTKTLKSIYGHWTWRRRPVLVKYNGHVYAASMNGMPHGTSTISNNNFDGHFCIHFYRSKTHGSGKVDDMHQKCVKEAMNYSW